MSRARNIKPGFFKNELLAELDISVRMLFIGLWLLADREGRLEDRPKRIKAELFAYDNIDVDAGLNALQELGFINRYGDGLYIQVIRFRKHQNPHVKEAASVIPAPEGSDTSVSTSAEHSASTVLASGLSATDISPALDESGSGPADSLSLDSPSSDSPSSDSLTQPSAALPAAVLACQLMRSKGCSSTNPEHPGLVAAVAEGVSPEELAQTAGEAIARGTRNAFAWAIATSRARKKEASRSDGPPTAGPSKTAIALLNLERLKHEMAAG